MIDNDDNIKLSVIISCYNSKNNITSCLRALSNQTYNNIEIIIVDANSSDGTPEIIKEHFPNIRLVSLSNNIGVGAALNVGMKIATGEVLAIDYNTDEIASNTWAEYLIKAHQKYGSRHIIGTTRLLDENTVDEYGVMFNKYSGSNKIAHKTQYENDRDSQICDFVGLSSFRNELIDLIGYKNENYQFYGGDADFNLRARIAGYTIRTNPKSTTNHLLSASKQDDIVKYYQRMTFGILRLTLVHGTKMRICRTFLYYLIISPSYSIAKSILFSLAKRNERKKRDYLLKEIKGRYFAFNSIVKTLKLIIHDRKNVKMKLLR